MNDTIAAFTSERKDNKLKTWYLFLFISSLSIFLAYAFQNIIMSKELYYNLYGSQVEEYRIDGFISLMQKLEVWGYFVAPIFILIRITFVAFLLQLPFMYKYIEIPFKDFFRIVAIAYLALLLSDITRFLYLYYQPIEYITVDSLSFIPLSLANLLDKSSYSIVAYSFLQKINMFEMLWCILAYRGINNIYKIEKIDVALIVFGVWVGLVVLSSSLSLFLNYLV